MIDKSLNISVFFCIIYTYSSELNHKQIYHNNYSATMLLFYSQYEYYIYLMYHFLYRPRSYTIKRKTGSCLESASTNLNGISFTNRVFRVTYENDNLIPEK